MLQTLWRNDEMSKPHPMVEDIMYSIQKNSLTNLSSRVYNYRTRWFLFVVRTLGLKQLQFLCWYVTIVTAWLLSFHLIPVLILFYEDHSCRRFRCSYSLREIYQISNEWLLHLVQSSDNYHEVTFCYEQYCLMIKSNYKTYMKIFKDSKLPLIIFIYAL